MNEHTHWWEPLFTGQLEVGVNKEKLENLTEESLLYYAEDSTPLDSAF